MCIRDSIVLDENGAGMPGGKWTNYDWGVRSACVIKWPGLAASETNAIAQYCDVLPTLIEAAGGAADDLDGRSLLPVIQGKRETHRDYGYFVHNTQAKTAKFSSRAITDGRYKLIWTLTPDQEFICFTVNGYQYGFKDKMEDRHVRKMHQSWANSPQAEPLLNRYTHRPEFQLYDLDQDPYELENLAKEPAHQERLKTLHQKLQEIMAQQDDPGYVYK